MFIDFKFGDEIISINAEAVVAVLSYHRNKAQSQIYVAGVVFAENGSADSAFIVDGSREECIQRIVDARTRTREAVRRTV